MNKKEAIVIILITSTFLLINSCSLNNIQKQIFKIDEYDKVVKLFFKAAQKGDLKEINKYATKEERGIESPENLLHMKKMSEAWKDYDFDKMELINWNKRKQLGTGIEYVIMKYKLSFLNDSYLLVVKLQNVDDTITISGFDSEYLDPIISKHEFTVSGKSFLHFIVLVVILIYVAFTLVVLIDCLRNRSLKIKILWILFFLIGIGKLGFNWTTGGLEFSILSFQIPFINFSKSIIDPLMINFSVPIGIIIYFKKKAKQVRKNNISYQEKEN